VKNAIYDTSLTDAQWLTSNRCCPNRPNAVAAGDRRRIIDAILYLVKCGCPWRYLPFDFPHWKTVYHIFRQWMLTIMGGAHDALRTLVRKTHGKRSRPTRRFWTVKVLSLLVTVAMSAMTPASGSRAEAPSVGGYFGLLLGVAVTPASTTERDGAQLVLGRVLGWFAWLRILWVDGGYTGETFANWVKALRPKLAVTSSNVRTILRASRSCPSAGSWERTFGWLMRHRRLVRDYETTEFQRRSLDSYRDDPHSTPPTGLIPIS